MECEWVELSIEWLWLNVECTVEELLSVIGRRRKDRRRNQSKRRKDITLEKAKKLPRGTREGLRRPCSLCGGPSGDVEEA